jgi:hypothetical protein
MAVHLAARRVRVSFDVGVGVKLGEEFGPPKFAECCHKGLIPVIAGTKITGFEGMSGCKLGNFLAVAEDAEFGSSTHHLASAQEAGVAAFTSQSIILQDFFLRQRIGRIQLFVCNHRTATVLEVPVSSINCLFKGLLVVFRVISKTDDH